MRTALKWLGYVAGGLAALLAVGFAVGAWYYRDIPADVLLAKYGNAQSQFITLDGARVHYRDEGVKDGPAVVLIHAPGKAEFIGTCLRRLQVTIVYQGFRADGSLVPMSSLAAD